MAQKQCLFAKLKTCDWIFFILVIDQLLCNPPHPFATKKELSCNLFRSWLQTISAERTTYGVAISIYFAAAYFTLCKVIIMSVLQFFFGKSRAWFEHSRNGLHIWLTGQTCQLCPRLAEWIILKYFCRAVRIPDNCHWRCWRRQCKFFWPVSIFTDLTRKIGIFDRFFAKKWRFLQI